MRSRLIERAVTDGGATLSEATSDFRFAATVASFGMLLRHSPYQGDWSYAAAAKLATESLGADVHGRRREFVELVRMAESVRPR